jgi:uncharacterized membrane protein YdfJ with MMPL/SSD domain
MMDRLARALYRRCRAVLAAGALAIVLAGAFGGPVFRLLDTSSDFDDPGSEAVRARTDVTRATGASARPEVVALVRLAAPVDAPAAQGRIDRVAAALSGPGVAAVTRYEPGGPRELVSRDGRSTYLTASFRAGAGASDALDGIEERLRGIPGVTLGGNEVASDEVGTTVTESIARAESFAVPIILLLSFLVFRSFVAGLIPLGVGMATILLSFLVMRLVDAVEPMSIYALNLITGLGLGLAIDYSLFMVSRFREELERRGETAAALGATMATAGRTVLFSSLTVAAALASLLVFPQKFLYSMGAGGIVCALAACLVALTMLPALLAALGPRVNALSPRRWRAGVQREARGERSGPWYRLSRFVMARPATIAILSGALLLVLGTPFLRVQFTGVDASVLPRDAGARIVDDTLRSEFPSNRASPVYVGVRAAPSADAQVRAYAQRLGALPGVVAAPRVAGNRLGWRIDFVAAGPPLGERAKDIVRAARDVRAPFPAAVGGETASFLDQLSSLDAHLPVALAALATTTLVILFLMTGSVVLPITALLMNLLTLSAALGLLVLIFQDGRLEGLLGYESQSALESSQPVLLFAVAFGLSTDYGVFLLTRIKELHDRGRSNEEAVALGLQRMGRIVTFAALLFVIAIGAFTTSQIVFIKQLGLGTALAVLIDATIVRALLVPSLMKLLGERNWWAPRPLARLHARIGLSESGV